MWSKVQIVQKDHEGNPQASALFFLIFNLPPHGQLLFTLLADNPPDSHLQMTKSCTPLFPGLSILDAMRGCLYETLGLSSLSPNLLPWSP